jgi:hypothetical protein
MATPPENLICPPDPCPSDFELAVKLMSTDALSAMKHYKVPWAVIAQMAAQHYTSLEMLADRWPDDATCRAEADTDLEPTSKLKYEAKTMKLISMKVMQAAGAARTQQESQSKAVAAISDAKVDLIITLVRENLWRWHTLTIQEGDRNWTTRDPTSSLSTCSRKSRRARLATSP